MIHANKLVALQEYADLETGQLYEEKFHEENRLYDKGCSFKNLNEDIKSCTKCNGLNLKRTTENCTGFGNWNARIVIVGQSLHEPGMDSTIPFIKNCGYALDAALRLSGLTRYDVFITNVVHCHPPRNRASTAGELENCRPYVLMEIELIKPELIVLLGNDAKELKNHLNKKQYQISHLQHPASFLYGAPEKRIDWIVKLSVLLDQFTGEKE